MKTVKYLLLNMLLALTLPAMAQSSPIGDVNGDDLVNINDVNTIISLISKDKFLTPSADVNNDGAVTIADANIIISIILGGSGLPEEERDWVDLGLPSGTIWARRNVGAGSSEDYGDYFAWGETEPKGVYDWSTYIWCSGSNNKLTKYCTSSSYGTVDDKTELDPADDAACALYPGGRMPSLEQIQELVDSCKKILRISRNGVSGQLFVGPNGNTMFLPAAGYCWSNSLNLADSWGGYWSRTLSGKYPSYAYHLGFSSGYVYLSDYIRGSGLPVRAVRVSNN